MFPENVHTVFLSGNSVNKVLFESALYWAEFGETVWFISPQPFYSLPSGWNKPPDKEILKLIFFIYIPETKDLLIKLSEIHMLPRIPKIIIIMDLDHYVIPDKDNLSNSAFLTSCLTDATAVHARKFNTSSYLISSFKDNTNKSKLQTILDLYFLKQCKIEDSNINDVNFLKELFKTTK